MASDPDVCRCDHTKGEDCPHSTHEWVVDLDGPPGRCCICGQHGADKLCGEAQSDCECILHDTCNIPGLADDSSV